jgi:hypothetical protein
MGYGFVFAKIFNKQGIYLVSNVPPKLFLWCKRHQGIRFCGVYDTAKIVLKNSFPLSLLLGRN